MADDDTQRYLSDPEEPLVSDLSASSDAIAVPFAQLDSAEDYENMAYELTRASEHCRTAAKQMLDGEVPRACAHGFAAEGHMRLAMKLLEELSIRHAAHATLDSDAESSEDEA